MAGTKNVEFSNIENFGTKHIIYENPVSADFAALGAGRFSYCDANGLPTYFDECPSLYFIHQDTRQE